MQKSTPRKLNDGEKGSPRRVKKHFQKPTVTEQHHKESCDIKNIMRQAQSTGMIKHLSQTTGRYQNLIGRPEFDEAMRIVADANSMFETIPSRIREKFDNNPARWLEFVQNEENREEMAELGFPTDHLPEIVEEEQPVPVIIQDTEPPKNVDTDENSS